MSTKPRFWTVQLCWVLNRSVRRCLGLLSWRVLGFVAHFREPQSWPTLGKTYNETLFYDQVIVVWLLFSSQTQALSASIRSIRWIGSRFPNRQLEISLSPPFGTNYRDGWCDHFLQRAPVGSAQIFSSDDFWPWRKKWRPPSRRKIKFSNSESSLENSCALRRPFRPHVLLHPKNPPLPFLLSAIFEIKP